MTYRRPVPGTRIEELDTPRLLIDMDALEHNAGLIAETYKGGTCVMRQHAKNIKCPILAHLQIRHGGTGAGVCVAKISEAEVMVEAGIGDILITSQIGSAGKTDRVASLARYADVKVAVDHECQLELLSASARKLGSTIGVVIEVDTSMRRGGVRTPAQGAALASRVATMPGIELRGVMSHQTVPGSPDRETRFREGRRYIGMCLAVKDAIEASGMTVEIVSTGESWTYDLAQEIPEITEVQGGTYLLMGSNYDYMSEFRSALLVLGSVVSTPASGAAVGNVGSLALASPGGVRPVVAHPAGVEVERVYRDRIVLRAGAGVGLAIGDTFLLRSGQPDITVSRWDEFVAVRGGVVEAVWDISARGCHH